MDSDPDENPFLNVADNQMSWAAKKKDAARERAALVAEKAAEKEARDTSRSTPFDDDLPDWS